MKRRHLTQGMNGAERGDILVSVLVFAAIAVTMITGLTNWGATTLSSLRTALAKEQTFQIAEAGIDYYRWHLAQYPNDYKDGTDYTGTYYHDFYDKDGERIGSYALTITPPVTGSTKVTITSTATTSANPNVKRIIQSVLAQPSLAKYATVSNDNLRFGAGTNVYGTIVANGGIRFDGTAFNVIQSAKNTYTDPDTGQTRWGVWTSVSPADPAPPGAIVNNPAVFTAGRQFPVPSTDFVGLTLNLQQLQTLALTNGACSAPSCWSPSSAEGYHMVLNTNDTYTMYKVTALQSAPSGCTNDLSQARWGTWSIRVNSSGSYTGQTLIGTYAFPANGVIFVEDDLWVDGAINTARLTIVAGVLPDPGSSAQPNITVNKDLTYTNTDDRDVIGLIAQGNLNVGLLSDDDLTIDAALIAENGRVGRYYYDNSCRVNSTNYYTRNNLTLVGMIATALRYGFAYTDGTGYVNRNITYDGNLLYSPPPSFPLASTQYETVSWKQIQ